MYVKRFHAKTIIIFFIIILIAIPLVSAQPKPLLRGPTIYIHKPQECLSILSIDGTIASDDIVIVMKIEGKPFFKPQPHIYAPDTIRAEPGEKIVAKYKCEISEERKEHEEYTAIFMGSFSSEHFVSRVPVPEDQTLYYLEYEYLNITVPMAPGNYSYRIDADVFGEYFVGFATKCITVEVVESMEHNFISGPSINMGNPIHPHPYSGDNPEDIENSIPIYTR